MKVNAQLPRWFKSKPVTPKFDASKIDAENGIIRDVVMCQVGEAKGHYVLLEESFIEDLVAYANEHYAQIGLKARFGHPALSDTTMGKQMGVFKNFQKDGDKAIADLHLLESADKSPTNPGMREWMLSMAQERPDFVMSSIVFQVGGYYSYNGEGEKVAYDWDEFDDWSENPPFIEFGELYYCDLVEAGAATDNLFSSQFNQDKFAIQVIEFVREHPDLLKFLQENPAKIAEFSTKLGIASGIETQVQSLETDNAALNLRLEQLKTELSTSKALVMKLKERVPNPTSFEPGSKVPVKKDNPVHPFTQRAMKMFPPKKK